MGKSTRVGGGLLLVLLVLVLGYTFWDELQAVRETLNLTYEHHLLSAERDAPLKSVTIYRNGYSTGGVQMQLSAELLSGRTGEGELAAYLSQFIAVEGLEESAAQESETTAASNEKELKVPGAVADRVYNGRGELLKTYQDIRTSDRLYLVAPGLLFVWPFVELGHRVTLPFKENSTQEPMIIESISESPRVFRLHNFFNGKEADKLIERTLSISDPSNKLQQSYVAQFDSKIQTKTRSKSRTSENAFDTVSETAVNIRKRVFDVLSLGKFNEDMCDGLQLLRYQQKQAYTPHTDYYSVDSVLDYNFDPHTGGSNRFATVFMYLSDVEFGGQTVFPHAEMPEGLPAKYLHPSNVEDFEAAGEELFEPGSWELDMVRKCSTKLAFYPSKGGAILFYSQKPNGELDPMSLHGGCPVLKGTKWGANLWVWNKRRHGLDREDIKYKVTFSNPTSRTVGIYWLDTLMTTLGPNISHVYTTYEGHQWVLKDGDQVILDFVVTDEDGKVRTVTVPPLNDDDAAEIVTDKGKPSDNDIVKEEL